MWFQVMDKAKKDKRPMILVTDDRKEDWWRKSEGKTIGPYPDLLTEMSSVAGIPFYIYAGDPFLQYARIYLNQSIAEEVIDEVRQIRKQDEEN